MLFLGTEHPSNQNEGDESGGEEDESEEDRNIREANAGHCGVGCEVIRHTDKMFMNTDTHDVMPYSQKH